jgi:hypothetical protein
MNSQADHQPLASVEADLFGVLFGFHTKAMTLLRESSLNDHQLKIVGDQIKALLEQATADMKATKQMNLTQRLDAAYEEVKRLVDELRQSREDKKAKPKSHRKKKP